MEVAPRTRQPGAAGALAAPLAAGEFRSCFAMTEPEYAGSNPVWMSTTAVKDGDDYLIDGHKWFTTAADGAAFAIVMAVTDPDHRQTASSRQPDHRAAGYAGLRMCAISDHGRGGEAALATPRCA